MEFGKIEYRLAGRGNGRSSVRTLHLTLIGLEDKGILARRGVKGLRLNRIMRLANEAMEQGCPLGYEDLSALLLTSLSTLKRDMAYLGSRGYDIPLRGRRQKNGIRAAQNSAGFVVDEGCFQETGERA